MRDEELESDLRSLDGEAFLAKRHPDLYQRVMFSATMSNGAFAATNGAANGHSTVTVTDIVRIGGS